MIKRIKQQIKLRGVNFLYFFLLLGFLVVYSCGVSENWVAPDSPSPAYLSGIVADGYLEGAEVFYLCSSLGGSVVLSNSMVTTDQQGKFHLDKFFVSDAGYEDNSCIVRVSATNTRQVKDSDDVDAFGQLLTLEAAGRSGFYLSVSLSNLSRLGNFSPFISPLSTLNEIIGANKIQQYLGVTPEEIFQDYLSGNGGERSEELRRKAKIINAYLEQHFDNQKQGIIDDAYTNLVESVEGGKVENIYLFTKSNPKKYLIAITKNFLDTGRISINITNIKQSNLIASVTNFDYEIETNVLVVSNSLIVPSSWMFRFVYTNDVNDIYVMSNDIKSVASNNFSFNVLPVLSNFYQIDKNYYHERKFTVISNRYKINFYFDYTNTNMVMTENNTTNYITNDSVDSPAVTLSLIATNVRFAQETNRVGVSDLIETNYITNFYIRSERTNFTVIYPLPPPPKLIISEVGSHGGSSDLIYKANSWIEVYNPNDEAVNLSNYQLKANAISFDTSSSLIRTKYHQTFSFPSLEIDSKSYLLIRFSLRKIDQVIKSKNALFFSYESDSEIIIPALWDSYYSTNTLTSGKAFGYFDLVRRGRTVDYLAVCSDGGVSTGIGGGEIASPTTGNFDRCLHFEGNLGGSLTRDQSLTDTDKASDWTYRSIATPGGLNDVVDTADNDQDGIPDANENPGTTFIGMPLYDWGARSGIKDIFVHIDYMDRWRTDPGMNPYREALQKIKNAFNAKGFNIHFDVGSKYNASVNPADFNLSGKSHEVPYVDFISIDFAGNFNDYINPSFKEYTNIYDYKYRYMPIERLQIFHYMIMAAGVTSKGNKLNNFVGIAELPGNDSLIAWGDMGLREDDDLNRIFSINQIANTIMHELGHNFNLRHGGNVNDNYKPNYLSTMNYLYGSGLPAPNVNNPRNLASRYYLYSSKYYKIPDGYSSTVYGVYDGPFTTNFRIDYSSGICPDLNENSVIEANGINCGLGLGGADWGLNGTISSSAERILVDHNNTLEILKDYNDWANLYLPFSKKISGYNDYSPTIFSTYTTSKVKSNLNEKLDPLSDDLGNWVE